MSEKCQKRTLAMASDNPRTTPLKPPGCHHGSGGQLPNRNPLVWRKIQLVSGLEVERQIPCINIRHHAINAKSSGRVDVAHQLVSQGFVARLSPPGLRVCEKKALLPRVSVDHWSGLAPQREVIGIKCDY